MTSIEFLRPRLEGARFDDGGVPLEFLSDLVALRELVLEVAKWRFLENHPERQRSPRGFTNDVGLKLIGLEGGSATPVIGLSANQSLALIPEVPYQRYLEEAVEYIVQDIDDVGTGASASPSGRLPRKYYAYFDRIGRSLREGEHIDFSVPSGTVRGRLDRDTRRKLLAISNIRELTQEVSLRGLVPEADQDRMTFELQPIYGHKVSGPIEEQHYETIVQAFNEFRNGMRILVNGVGSYNQQNRLLRLASIRYISELDPLEVNCQGIRFEYHADGDVFPHLGSLTTVVKMWKSNSRSSQQVAYQCVLLIPITWCFLPSLISNTGMRFYCWTSQWSTLAMLPLTTGC